MDITIQVPDLDFWAQTERILYNTLSGIAGQENTRIQYKK